MSKKKGKSRITRKLLAEYILSIVVIAVLVVIVTIVGWEVRNYLRNHGNLNWMYEILEFCAEYFPLILLLICLMSWLLVSYYFLSRPLRYLDEIIFASEQLAHPTEEPILLPEEMVEVEVELNQVREQALSSAAAAREAEKQKNDMIVCLAHDLKTPLTSVIGYLTLLRDEPQISAELRAKYTGIALKKALRLEELINEFFDITRFHLTTLTLELSRISLSRMLEQVSYEFLPVLAEKDMTISAEIQPEVDIRCDPDKLERVFDNLLRNAVAYGDEGSEITLSMRRQEQQAEVLVKNRGKPIPPEKLDQIFQQFFRLDESRATATGGAGLGLAIAKEIVELHGGKIWAESRETEALFTMTLPLNC